jgi:hypothetical protein
MEGKKISASIKNEEMKEQTEKKRYKIPIIEEHKIIDKASACSLYSARYVSGYGYYY